MSNKSEIPENSKTEDITESSNGQESKTTPKKQSEQALTERLAASEHFVTEGATMPNETPIPAEAAGQDAENRGRGRPRMTDDEREAARERKRARDRERSHKKHGTTAKAKPEKTVSSGSQDEPDPMLGIAQGNAQLVCAALDLLAKGISAGEFQGSPEVRAGVVQSWAAWMYEEKILFPLWAQAAIMSIAYVAPAFATPTGRGRVGGAWARLKGWWVTRKG